MQTKILSKAIILRIAAFLLILCTAIVLAGAVLKPKNGIFNAANAPVLNEAENTVDVIAIGASDVLHGVAPMEWYLEHGYTGYNCGVDMQTPADCYFSLKEMYTMHSPKVVFWGAEQIINQPKAIGNDQKNRLSTLIETVGQNATAAFRRHNNWKTPAISGDGYAVDAMKGVTFLTETISVQPAAGMTPTQEVAFVTWVDRFWFNRIVNLCRANGSRVVLTSIPFHTWNMQQHNAMQALADAQEIDYIDFNSPEILQDVAFDWSIDTASWGTHVSVDGALKVSRYLGDYLAKSDLLIDRRATDGYTAWDAASRTYELQREDAYQAWENALPLSK